MRYQGKISTWKDDQGYGFITPTPGGEPVFVHIKAFAGRPRRPAENDRVSYALNRDPRGRLRAGQVEFVVEGAGRRNRLPAKAANPARTAAAAGMPSRLPLIIAGLFLALLAVNVLVGKAPPAILALYLVLSVVTFAAYGFDKAAAREGRWRTQESTLHLLALLGGWPGALAAQNRLRHKSRKADFLLVFWATVLLNCGALGLLLSPAGGKALRTALGGS